MKSIVENEEILLSLKLPEKLSSEKNEKEIYSLGKPQLPYGLENIDSMIWIILWISCYHYHDDVEKKTHIQELISVLTKMKADEHLKSLVLEYVVEVVSSYGKTLESIFPNFLYLLHWVRNMVSSSSYLKFYNQFLIFTKELECERKAKFPIFSRSFNKEDVKSLSRKSIRMSNSPGRMLRNKSVRSSMMTMK